MNVKFLIIMAAICVVAFSILVYLNFILLPNYQSDEAKLRRGEISLDQYCSNLGHAAVNETKCKGFVKKYGYNPF
jgi:hypothetical protein